MIQSFRCKESEKIFHRFHSKKFPKAIQQRAYRKMLLLHASVTIMDLRIPPSNHLEKLSGNYKGRFSIRINKQWRLCFNWKGHHAYDVEIVDYH